MEKIKLNVEGMHCHSCELLITDALKEHNGIKNVNVNYKTGYVDVEWDDSTIKKEEIIEIIKQEGYKVKR